MASASAPVGIDAARPMTAPGRSEPVRVLDAASAATTATLSGRLGGPDVQLAAQAVAGTAAAKAGERALNTLRAKLREPDPDDVAHRQAIERRSEQVRSLAPQPADDAAVRRAVKQDVEALLRIDDPRERHVAAVVIGRNADAQPGYREELVRQNPEVTAMVALSRAKQQVDDREEVKPNTRTMGAASAQVHRIDHAPSLLPTAGPSPSGYRPPALEDRFNVIAQFGRGRTFEFRDQPGRVAFQERWSSMNTSVDAPVVIKAMLDRAHERGWHQVRLHGSEEFKRQAWIAASARGITALGHEATDGDRSAARQEQIRLGIEHRPVVEGKDRSQAPSADANAINRVPVAQSNAVKRDGRSGGSPRPVADASRDALARRGDTDIESTIAYAQTRFKGKRVYVGQIVDHGRESYAFDDSKEQSYYVRLRSSAGDKVVWGRDLERAVRESGVQAGDSVVLEHRGMQPVTVSVKERDTSGAVIGRHDETAHRNAWHAENIDRLRADALADRERQGKAALDHPGPSAAALSQQSDRLAPSRAPESVPKRDAAILQALDAAFEVKGVPQALRDDVRTLVRQELDARRARSTPVDVAIYDPAAAPRHAPRSGNPSRSQHKEHERAR